MTTKVAVFTGTRAEYGLLYWLLKDLQAEPNFQLQLIVSGSHLSTEFGYTVRQIEDDGFAIAERIDMLLDSQAPTATAKSLGLGVIGYADALQRQQPDVMIILGDRFEALAMAQTAMLMRVPILHIHGGEITEGAYDDAIRHAISKFSYWHATAAEPYRQRVIQLGEHPDRVWNVGAIGLDHLQRSELMSKEQLADSLNFTLDRPYAVVTYHPVTLADEPAQASFNALLEALDQHPDMAVIITYPNADDGGRQLIPVLEAFAQQQPERVLAIPSLGQQRYLSAVKHAAVVVGNSSSGIIEVPAFGVPTVNIGQRQQGRLAANSVIHCEPKAEAINAAIQQALEHKLTDADIENPYGQGNASQQIVAQLQRLAPQLGQLPIKTFYDWETPS